MVLHYTYVPTILGEETPHDYVLNTLTVRQIADTDNDGVTDVFWTDIGYQTYVQSIDFTSFSSEDVRFTVTGTPGAASLVIHFDAQAIDVVIPHFEDGMRLQGIGYMTSMPENQLIPGYGSPAEEGFLGTFYDIQTGTMVPVDNTYFLEEIAFYDTTIDMQNDVLTFTGTSGGDTLYGLDTRADIIKGMDGSDSIMAQGGNDILIGGAGFDYLYGGDGNDTYVFNLGDSAASDSVVEYLGGGTDTILLSGISSVDVFAWVSGSQYHIKYSSGDEIIVNVGNGVSGETTLGSYVEQLQFSNTTWDLTHGLHMTADDASHSITGSAYGDDIRDGSVGNDIHGYGGDDVLTGGGGYDYLYGGADDDTYEFSAGDSTSGDRVTEYSGEGTDTVLLHGVDPEDVHTWIDGYSLVIEYSSNDYVYINGGADSYGGTDISSYVENIRFDDDTVWDLTQGLVIRNDDTARYIEAGSHDDLMIAGNGGDHLYGYDGDDTFVGGDGVDYFSGGNGADTFAFHQATAFNNSDYISDFHTAQGDVVDLRDVLSNYDPMTDSLSDFVQITDDGSDSFLNVDLDGAGATYSMTQIATLFSVTGLTDEAALVSSGNLLVA